METGTMSPQELQVQQKRELEKKQEATIPARVFVPTTDIFETEQALTLVAEMPGVDKDKVDVSVEDGVLTIQGQIDFSKYEGIAPRLHGIQHRPLSAHLHSVEPD
jgi:HSP20 family protein